MMNIVTLMGRITADPELRTTPSGVSVCKFTLAVDRNYVSKGSSERQADFINCTAWRSTAEFISRYFVKGQLMAVQGSIQTGSYTDNNGNKRYTTDVIVEQVYFTGDKRENSGSRNSYSGNNGGYSNNNYSNNGGYSGNSGFSGNGNGGYYNNNNNSYGNGGYSGNNNNGFNSNNSYDDEISVPDIAPTSATYSSGSAEDFQNLPSDDDLPF